MSYRARVARRDFVEAMTRPDALDPTSSASARTFLERYADTAALLDLVMEILDDPATRRGLLADSYRHVLGFSKYVLFNVPDVGQLRLHVWHEGAEALDHVHGHRFPFFSSVVHGSLRMRIYQRSTQGAAYQEFREGAAEADQRWQFEDLGSTYLQQTADLRLPAPTTYFLHEDALHTTTAEVDGGFAVSLLMQAPLRRNWSPVLARATTAEPAATNQVRFSAAEVRADVALLRRAVAGPVER